MQFCLLPNQGGEQTQKWKAENLLPQISTIYQSMKEAIRDDSRSKVVPWACLFFVAFSNTLPGLHRAHTIGVNPAVNGRETQPGI